MGDSGAEQRLFDFLYTVASGVALVTFFTLCCTVVGYVKARKYASQCQLYARVRNALDDLQHDYDIDDDITTVLEDADRVVRFDLTKNEEIEIPRKIQTATV
tara:strand:+ start:183 stop:488 length:306 start_codon:yes stop_codon:yes gene_type:complete